MAVLVAVFAGLLLGAFDRALGLVLVGFLAVAGVVLPLTAAPVVAPSGAGARRDPGGARARCSSTRSRGSPTWSRSTGPPTTGRASWRSGPSSTGPPIDWRWSAARPRPWPGRWPGLAAVAVLAIGTGLVAAGRLDGVYLAILPLVAVASFEVIPPLTAAFGLQPDQRGRRAPAVRADRRRPRRSSRTRPGEPRVRPRYRPPPGIEVHGLTFRYAPDEPVVLDGLSFSVPPCGSLAIVGPSGSGKSTLVSLLARFWEYDDGEILIGGRSIRELTGDDVRGLLGVVPQDVHLFNATIRDNLALADADVTDETIVEACRIAQVHDAIEALPDGYATRVGENGLLLSGGERQRLAIARAIIKDAPILVLDEATANLDVATEQRLMASLAPFIAGRTTIVISHREDVSRPAWTARSGLG